MQGSNARGHVDGLALGPVLEPSRLRVRFDAAVNKSRSEYQIKQIKAGANIKGSGRELTRA